MHDTNLLEDQPIAWEPTPDVIERAQLTKFMKQVGVSTWAELYQFSIGDVEKFTDEVLKFLDIKFDPPYSRLLDTSDGIEFPNWFISPPRRGDAEENAERGMRNAESDPSPFEENVTSEGALKSNTEDSAFRIPRSALSAVVFFGTSTYAAEEAIEMLEADGIALDAMRVRAFPFGKAFRDFIDAHERIFVIEQNRDAQFRSLMMIELGVNPAKIVSVLNYDGMPITADNIYRQIKHVIG